MVKALHGNGMGNDMGMPKRRWITNLLARNFSIGAIHRATKVSRGTIKKQKRRK